MHSTATKNKREKERVCVRKGSLFIWLFDICGLQFEIVREICYHLVLVLRFGDLLSLGALQLLDFFCLVHIWFFGLYVGKNYLGVFDIWVCVSVSTPICIIPNFL